MSLAIKLLSASGGLLSASGGGVDKLYVDDVFSAYTYTGNGSTQTINNGIDLAGKGGLVWIKRRDSGFYGNNDIVSSANGNGNTLTANTTDLLYALGRVSFGSSGFVLTNNSVNTNASSGSYTSWTFRKAPKFFDVVTGTLAGNTTINHSLGVAPGMIIAKRTDSAEDWFVYHRGCVNADLVNCDLLKLNLTNAVVTGNGTFGNVTSSSFMFRGNAAAYVFYIFAHDASADGIIQCGSFTTDGSGNATVNLGWEPQYLIDKNSSISGNWYVSDTMRGMSVTSFGMVMANTEYAEQSGAAVVFVPTATGFNVVGFTAGVTHVYLAIRRPNKPPTLGTQVYNAIARTGTGAAATVTGVGFAPDMLLVGTRNNTNGHAIEDRLRGSRQRLNTYLTAAEVTQTDSVTSFNMDGVTLGADSLGLYQFNSGNSFINHFFKRAIGVMDIVCYTGTGASKTEAHNLGAVPELVIFKVRTGGIWDWAVYASALGLSNNLRLNQTTSVLDLSLQTAMPTASVLNLATSGHSNGTSKTYVAYLFASKAGISKVGSYTGNGTSQTIDCGFTTGARFVMIKAASTTGDWPVGDSTRGLVAGNDPRLSLNTTAAEVTTEDWLDPHTSGFIVNQVAGSSANASGVNYIVLAFA